MLPSGGHIQTASLEIWMNWLVNYLQYHHIYILNATVLDATMKKCKSKLQNASQTNMTFSHI